MRDILNTMYLKHDSSFKSLTKRALSQILLKIIYQNPNGIMTPSISKKLEEFISIKIAINDIDDSIRHLINEGKVNSKNGRHFIKNDFKHIIDKTVTENDALHKTVILNCFSNSETIKIKNGEEIIETWFSKTLIKFFKEYRNEWINDLKNRRHSGKRIHFDVEKILANSFESSSIIESDKLWLKGKFVEFLESDNNDNNSLMWYYGLSSFSASLLTARNYADEFSIDMFKDSKFILDTNILMIIELESHKLNYSFKPIAKTFEKLNIEPIYFYISKNEYSKAIARKKTATLNSLEKFNFNVVNESDCPFVRTAIRRGCKDYEDFERFFLGLENVPTELAEIVKVSLLDTKELNEEILQGSEDEETKNEIDKINVKRTHHSKSKNVLSHDAGLIYGALYLRNTHNKCWILTRDGTIREYANEKLIRDDFPIAIGLDSFIQMMAINSGGIEETSSNFAPLFAKIIQFSLLPEKNTFKVEDLYFMIQTIENINELPDEDVISIAQTVNKLKITGKEDDEITLSIQRRFNKFIVDQQYDSKELSEANKRIRAENERLIKNLGSLKSYVVRNEIADRKDKLDKKILLNWVFLFGIPLIIYILGYVAFRLFNKENSLYIVLIIPTIINILTDLLMIYKFKIKLKRTNKDDFFIETQVLSEIEKI